MRACVRAYVPTCVHTCVRACIHTCVRAYMRAQFLNEKLLRFTELLKQPPPPRKLTLSVKFSYPTDLTNNQIILNAPPTLNKQNGSAFVRVLWGRADVCSS